MKGLHAERQGIFGQKGRGWGKTELAPLAPCAAPWGGTGCPHGACLLLWPHSITKNKKRKKKKKKRKKRKFRLGFLSNITLAGSLPLCVPMPISQNVGAKRGGAALRFHQLAEQTPAASPCCPHVPAANFQMPDGKCLGLQLKAPGAPCTRDPHEQHGFVESGCRTWLGPVHLQRQGQARGLLWCFHAENPFNPTHSGHPFLHAAMASSEQSCRKPRGSAEPLL